LNWYLIHTKPRLEVCALQNLEQQGFACFLPLIRVEKLRRSALVQVEEPLFPRYLFIQLGSGSTAQSWAPIRSTKGVSRLVCFGQDPAKLDDALVAQIRTHNQTPVLQKRHFTAGEAVVVSSGPFIGLDAIYQMNDGESRVMVLLNIMSKPVQLTLAPSEIKKAV